MMTQVAAKYGKTFTWDIKVQLMGQPGSASSQKAVELMELPIVAEQFSAELQVLKDELFKNTKLLPGKILSYYLVNSVESLQRHLY